MAGCEAFPVSEGKSINRYQLRRDGAHWTILRKGVDSTQQYQCSRQYRVDSDRFFVDWLMSGSVITNVLVASARRRTAPRPTRAHIAIKKVVEIND